MTDLAAYGELRDAAAQLEETRRSSALELLDALESVDPGLVKEGLDLAGSSRGFLADYLTEPIPTWGGTTCYEMLASGERARVVQLFSSLWELPSRGSSENQILEPAELSSRAFERRRLLAAQWLTAPQASRMLGSRADHCGEMATELRRAGRLLGVWVPHERAYRYPVWQFIPEQATSPMQTILRILRQQGGLVEPGRRTSGWSEAAWFLAPHALLDARTPANVLASDPDRVVSVAREEFEGNADAEF